MAPKVSHLRNVVIAAPCDMGWENLHGDGTVRFCDKCALNVKIQHDPAFEQLIVKNYADLLRNRLLNEEAATELESAHPAQQSLQK